MKKIQYQFMLGVLLLLGVLANIGRAGEPYYKEDSIVVPSGVLAVTSTPFKVVSSGVGRERWNGALMLLARNASTSTGAVSFVSTSIGVSTTIATSSYLTNGVNNTETMWPMKLRTGAGYTNTVLYPVRELSVIVTLQATNALASTYYWSFFGE